MRWLREQKFYKSFTPDVQKMFYILDYLPTFYHVIVKKNRVYIQTSRKRKDLAEFIIMDFSGNILKTVYLPNAKEENNRLTPAANCTFHKNSYYYLSVNEDDEWRANVQLIK